MGANGLVISNNRIRNNLADGVNFCKGTQTQHGAELLHPQRW